MTRCWRRALAGWLAAASLTATAQPSPPLQALPSLDVAAYMGTWYQVAWIPNRFQKQCVSDTVATYRDLGDGRIEVLNRCKQADGSIDVFKVPSVPSDPSQGVLDAVAAAAAGLGTTVPGLLGSCGWFVHGSTIATNTVLERKGAKVGMVKLRFVRPWPTEKVMEVLSKFKAVGVIESSTSYGGCMKGGKLMEEVRASLYDSPKQPAVTSFMAGLGGEVVSLDEFYNMAKILETAAKKGKVDQYVYWVGFDNGI